MTLNLQDRRIVTALAAVFTLGLACVLLLALAVLTLCAMLVNALVGTIAEICSTISALYNSGGSFAHLVMLLGILFGVPYSFKKVRTPVLHFFQRQFARFSAFAQQQTPPAAHDAANEDERDYEEGEVIDLDAEEEKVHQARTAANPPHTGSRRTTANKPRKKRQRRAKPARAMLALTRV